MIFKKHYKIIKKSGLFDERYYLTIYEDVRKADIDPIKHYIKHGWKEGRNPSEQFDTNFYLKTYQDVKVAGMNPLIHYIKYRKKENRIAIQKVDINFQKTVKIIKAVKNNPRLIKRAISEIKLHGLKKTIQKVKNKYNRIEDSISQKDKMKNFSELNNLFNKEIFIPDFKLEKPIDIIIPVYNGFQFLEPLIKSIIKNTSINYRILMCDDKSSDEKVLPLLKHFQEQNPLVDIILLENEQNFGFIKTVNKLVTHTQNHFVLLNTDTEVPPHWLERLMYPIFKMKNIASTTPFTNAGTICSFPNYLEDNPIFENMDLESLDQYFQYVNFEKTYIEIPTGVGFCMGVNKNLVDKIGMFDEVFGKGYGEENDWCQRAIKEGYKNLHVTNLFVYHKHGGSFPNEEKQNLLKKNLGLLQEHFPNYMSDVKLHIDKNSLKDLRELISIKILSENNSSILILDHLIGGGANVYVQEIVKQRIAKGMVTYLLNFHHIDNSFLLTIYYNKTIMKYKSHSFNSMIEIFNIMKIKYFIINELIPIPNYEQIIEDIILIKQKFSVNITFLLHDYYAICPSYNLLDHNSKFCEVPKSFYKCKECFHSNYFIETNTPWLNNSINLGSLKIEKWRYLWYKLLNNCDKIVCFSNSSKEILLKSYSNLNYKKIIVEPHHVNWINSKVKHQIKVQNDFVNIAIIGYITIPKGLELIIDMVEYIESKKLKINIFSFGGIDKSLKSEVFFNYGKYNRQELPKLIENNGIDIIFIPSIWPETFSYTTEESILMDIPVAVFNLGAPAERIRNYNKGLIIDQIDAIYALERIENFVRENYV